MPRVSACISEPSWLLCSPPDKPRIPLGEGCPEEHTEASQCKQQLANTSLAEVYAQTIRNCSLFRIFVQTDLAVSSFITGQILHSASTAPQAQMWHAQDMACCSTGISSEHQGCDPAIAPCKNSGAIK